MLRSIFLSGRISRLGRWCCAVAMLVCLGCWEGCASLDDLDERPQYDRLHDLEQHFPRRDQRTEPFAVTNKGRQIARDLGVR